jgi:hypothetical protein
MADFMTPDEIEKFKELVEQQYRDGFITAKQYNQAQKDAAIGVRGYTNAMESSLKQLGTSFKALGKDIYDGKKGVGVFSGTLDTGATAVAAYATKFGPAGIALGAFTKAVTAFVTASLKQSDLLFDSYEKISRAGAVGAGAMTEVFDNMLKFGYTVDQLNELGNLLARNSRNFGVFFKSALDGTRAFSEVADSIQNSALRQQFFRLGLGVNEINDGIAGFVNQQGKLGRAQGRTVDQLAAGAAAYIKELDILTKLTGMTRQEQEDAREQALQIRQFYAGLADLDDNAAEQALQAFTMAMARGGPEAAADMAADFNGVITGAGKMFMATGGRSMEVFSKEFFARGGTAAESFERLQQYISPEFIEMTKNMNQLNSDMGSFDARVLMMFKGGSDAERLSKIMARLTDEQYKQLTGMDKATAGQARARDSQIKGAQNLQEFVKLGVAPATQALAYFTEAIEYLTNLVPGAGSAKKRRAEEQAIKEGRSTATTRAQSAYQTGTAAMGYEMGGAGLDPADVAGSDASLGNLRIKSPEAYSGGKTSQQLMSVARAIQDKLGGDLTYFSAFNDSYDKRTNPAHSEGRALDFTLNDPRKAAAVAALVRGIPGISKVIDEYANPSASATGGHIHAEISAANGAILSGPASGYKPNLTMHGTEAIVPLNSPAAQSAFGGSDQTSIMSAQLDKLDELVRVMQNQVSVSTKILQAAN